MGEMGGRVAAGAAPSSEQPPERFSDDRHDLIVHFEAQLRDDGLEVRSPHGDLHARVVLARSVPGPAREPIKRHVPGHGWTTTNDRHRFGVMEASARSSHARRDLSHRNRSPAQIFCLVVGATLVLVGLLDFLAEATFDTGAGGDGGALDGENFIIFEVSGWHNVVHIASGLFLLALMRRHDGARLAALAFGAIYGVVTLIGLIDGKDVLGLLPVNPGDNVLHILLTVAALAAGSAPARARAATVRQASGATQMAMTEHLRRVRVRRLAARGLTGRVGVRCDAPYASR